MKEKENVTTKTILVKPPNMKVAEFTIKGNAPLVVHRFTKKAMDEIRQKMLGGKPASNVKNRKPVDFDEMYRQSRYINADGWDGFHAGAIRAAMISACRLVGFKMTLAKLSIFVIADGWDKEEPWVPLIKINGKSEKLEGIAYTSTNQPYITSRAAYYDWSANVKIRWDADQFTVDDIYNLLSRVGEQVGICEGRPDSKNSPGMSWGTFDIIKSKSQ